MSGLVAARTTTAGYVAARSSDQQQIDAPPYTLRTMRGALAAVVLTLAVSLVACGSAVPRLLPPWCGAPGTGVLPPQPGATHRPVPDRDHLLCIAVENHSDVDMVLARSVGYGPLQETGPKIAACRGVAVSESFINVPPMLYVGQAGPPWRSGPTISSFDASQVTGDPPYLIEVVINSDLTGTIGQRPRLLMDPTGRRYC